MGWLDLLLVGGLVLLIPTAYAGYIGAPYAPTRKKALQKAFKATGLGTGDTLVDLGAGDGKVMQLASAQGATVVGYELSPLMWLIARIRLRHTSHSHLIYGNFYRQTLPPETTHLFVFLLPKNMDRVRTFLKKQRLTGGKVCYVYAFPFPRLTPVTVIREENCAPLYVYELEDLTAA